MLLCLCRKVSEKELVDAIRANTLSELFKKTQFGTECGTCLNEIRYLVEENYSEHEDDN